MARNFGWILKQYCKLKLDIVDCGWMAELKSSGHRKSRTQQKPCPFHVFANGSLLLYHMSLPRDLKIFQGHHSFPVQ